MKQLLASVALTLSVAVVGYLSIGMGLESSVRQQLQKLATEDPVAGLEFGQSWFQDMSVHPRGTVTWRNVRIGFHRADGELYLGGQPLVFTADVVTLGPRDGKDEYQLEVQRASVQLDRATSAQPASWREEAYRGSGYTIDTFTLNIPMESSDPGDSMRAALRKLAEVLTTEGSAVPFQIAGRAKLAVGEKLYDVPVTVQEVNGRWKVRLDPEALHGAVAKLPEPLAPDELAFLSNHPLWAPITIEIRDYVRTAVAKAREQDQSLPERAYAHVLWSYLLSREMGSGYAKEVIGHYVAAAKSSEAERQMDLQNAEVGRRFASDGLEQRRLIELAKSDPAVVRKTSSVRWSIK